MAQSWRAGNFHVQGQLSAGSILFPAGGMTGSGLASSADIARTQLVTETLAIAIPLSAWKIWDTLQQLPTTGPTGADDLGWYAGTFATSAPLIRTADVKAAGAQTMRARAQITLPDNYVSGGTISIRAFCGMVTTISDGAVTIDFEACKVTGATVGSDLVATAATSINLLTFANRDFVVTPTGLVAGDMLDVRMTVATADVAVVTAVIAAIARTQLLVQVKG